MIYATNLYTSIFMTSVNILLGLNVRYGQTPKANLPGEPMFVVLTKFIFWPLKLSYPRVMGAMPDPGWMSHSIWLHQP